MIIDGSEVATPTPIPNSNPEPMPTAETVARSSRQRTHIAQDDVSPTAFSRLNAARVPLALEHAKICAKIADDNKGRDILVLDLRDATAVVDFFVVATAASKRQSKALAIEIDIEMKKIGEHKLSMELDEEGRWTLIDYGDFIVHVFSEQARDYYRIEDLWADADRIAWE